MHTSFQEGASERRSTTRASLYLAATLYCDDHSFPVKIRNISSTGALLESRTMLTAGVLVQLVRGSLIVHGLVAWAEDGRYGLKFSGSVDVQQWRATPMNAEQQRVDDVVRLVKAGAVPLPINAPSPDRPDDANELSADLQRASALIGKLADRLAKDSIVVALYATELQNLDIAIQIIAAVEGILIGKTDLGTGTAKFASLRKSADQALIAAA